MAVRYRVRTPMVVAEVFADEVIAVNFDDGTYYSLGETGRDVWLGIQDQATVEEIVTRLGAHYVIDDPAAVLHAVQTFVDSLMAEGLIVRARDTAPATTTAREGRGERRRAVAASWSGGGRSPFRPPTLERHTDMQQLLLLDPIHEVDDGGWPLPRTP